MKNSILFFSLILITYLPLTSCSKDKNDVSPTVQKVVTNNIVGTWEHFYSDESLVYMMRLEFYNNGTYLCEANEIGYGEYTYPQNNLTLEQATAMIRSTPWGTSGEKLGTWATKDDKLLFVGGFFNDNIYDYSLVDNVLIINWDDEETMFSKLQQ